MIEIIYWWMDVIRGLIYRIGFRPKPGSILFSPSRHYRYTINASEAFRKAFANWPTTPIMVLGPGSRWVYIMNPCKVCGRSDDEKPMCFRGEDYCSDLHRKILSGEVVEEND